MKKRLALAAAAFLGLFAYSLPLYAGNTEYHIEELTVIDIPIVGKISTHTDSYLAGCQLKETTTYRMHNALIKAISQSARKTEAIVLSDLCGEIQWEYDDETNAFKSYSFSEIRENTDRDEQNYDVQIDMESDQNDIKNNANISHDILGYEKNINGFRARKVVTTITSDGQDHPVIVEEYYCSKAKSLTKITAAREKLTEQLGYGEDNVDGVPSFINQAYASIAEDEDWKRPEGEVVRFVISVVDDDNDPLFLMTYNVITAETGRFDADHFSLK